MPLAAKNCDASIIRSPAKLELLETFKEPLEPNRIIIIKPMLANKLPIITFLWIVSFKKILANIYTKNGKAKEIKEACKADVFDKPSGYKKEGNKTPINIKAAMVAQYLEGILTYFLWLIVNNSAAPQKYLNINKPNIEVNSSDFLYINGVNPHITPLNIK